MKIKTNELIGAQLDWAVAKCEGVIWVSGGELLGSAVGMNYSTDWSQGGPIIDREHINTCSGYQWEASKDFDAIGGDSDTAVEYGPTPLIAAMRCYVASKMGDEVEAPEELT